MVKLLAWFLGFFLLPIGLLPGFGVMEQGLIESLSLIICSAWLAYYSSSSTRGQFVGILFWVFSYVFMVVAPAAQFIAGGYPWFDYYSASDVSFASFLVFLGLLLTTIGALVPSSSKLKGSLIVNPIRLKLFLYFALVAAALSLVMLGVGTIFTVRAEQYDSSDGSNTMTVLIQALLRVPLFIASLVLFKELLQKKVKSFGLPKTMAIIGLVLLVLLLNNPISTARFWFACVILSYFFVFLNSLKWNLETLLAPFLVFLMLVVFPLSDVFRRSTDVDVIASIKSFELYEEISLSPDFDAFQQLINTTTAVENRGLTWGNQLLGALFFWVPRAVWHNKPVASGEYVVLDRNYSFVNLSCPLWAEIYLDFGIPGILLIFFAYGKLIRFSVGQSGVWFVFFVFFASFQPYLLRGSLLVASNFLLLAGACFISISSVRAKDIP